MVRRCLGTILAVALAAMATQCTPAPTGPACEEAQYQGRVVDATNFDYGAVTLEIDDRGRTAGRIDGVKDRDGHFLGEVFWADVEVHCERGHFDTINATATECGSENVKVRGSFTEDGYWDGWLEVWCGKVGKDDGTSLILTFAAFELD